MPGNNIVEYENKIDGLRPSEQGEEAYVRAGRLTGGFFHQLGQAGEDVVKGYQETMGNQEVSQGNALLMGAWAAAHQKLNATMSDPNTDPNDPTVSVKAMQQFQDNLDSMSAHFTTPKGSAFFREQSARLLDNFTNTAMAAQSHAAGVAAIHNLDVATASNGTVAVNDFAQLQTAIDNNNVSFAHVADASRGVMDSDAADALKAHRDEINQQTIIAASKSLILQQGQGGLDLLRQKLADPNWMKGELGGPERTELGQFADTQERMLKEEARQQKSDDRRDQDQAFQQGMSKYYAGQINSQGILQPGANSAGQLRQLAAMPGADASAIRAAADANLKYHEDSDNHVNTFDSYRTVNDFNARIGATGADALTHSEVDRAYADNQLSRGTYERLTASVEHVGSNPEYGHALELLNKAEESAKPLFKINDSMGASAVNTANAAAYMQWQAYNRQLFDLHINNDHMTPTQAAEAMTDQSNRMNTVRRVGDFLGVAQGTDAAGVASYFLAHPEPLTLGEAAQTAPAAAAHEAAIRGVKPGGLSKDQETWLAAHKRGAQ